MATVLQWMDTGSPERQNGEEEEERIFLCEAAAQMWGALVGLGEYLWVRIRGEVSEGDTTVGLGYGQDDWGKEADNAPHNNFFKQLKEVSGSRTLFFTRDFRFPNTCWRTKGQDASNLEDFWRVPRVASWTGTGQADQGCAQLDLLFRNKEEVAGDGILGGRLGCSDCEAGDLGGD